MKTLVMYSDGDGNSLHEEEGNSLGKGLPCSVKIHSINLKRKFYYSTSKGIWEQGKDLKSHLKSNGIRQYYLLKLVV